MRNPFRTFWKLSRSHGLKAGGIYVLDKIGRMTCHLCVEYLVQLPVDQITDVGPLPEGFTGRWLTPEEVGTFSQDASNDLPPEFAERTTEENRCFGILHEGRLASYGWYALSHVRAEDFFQTGMELPPGLSYMYKGFTHPDFRGRRLHAIGMKCALQALSRHGVQALVSTVAWTNLASLKSCDRLGYQRLGKLVQVRLLGRRFSRFPPAAIRLGMSLAQEPTALLPAQS